MLESVEWGELIAKRQTLIVDCSGMGKDKMVFLGTLVTQGLASYLRYSKLNEYLPISVYVDECHNFISASSSMTDILKEGRKYKISCTLATQDLAVIDQRMARVLLNSGSIVAYRLGHREAEYIARELAMSNQDIQFLERFHAAFMTPKGSGIAKAQRPPFVKSKETPVAVEPQRNSKKPSWFTLEPLESYHQAESQ